MGYDVKEYLEKQTLNCENYKLGIDKLPQMNATQNFKEILSQLIEMNNL